MGLRVARNIDLVVLALALALFAATGLPLKGWAIGAGAWIAQRLVRSLLERRAERSEDMRAKVGYIAGSMIGRGWLAAGIILGFGFNDNEAGLAGAVLFLTVFTISFVTTLITAPARGRRKGRALSAATASASGERKTSPARRTEGNFFSRLSTKWKVLLAFATMIALALIINVLSPSSGPQRRVQAAERVQARPVDLDEASAPLDMSINKAVLYLVLAAARSPCSR